MPPREKDSAVTVIVRTKNSEDTIGQALQSLHSQTYRDFDLLVVDSGSRDATLEIVRRYPCRIVEIRPEDYYPGPVLNMAISEARTGIVVFQNSDVVLLTRTALERLVEAVAGPDVHAAFGRQLPRPEALSMVRRDHAVAFPEDGPAPPWIPYSLPFAAMKKSAWLERAFYSDAWGSEDTEWGVRAREAGWSIRYIPEAAVMHSHNYTLREWYGRSFIEGEADAFIYGDAPSLRRSFGRAVSAAIRDLAWQIPERAWSEAAAGPVRRAVSQWGHYRGHLHGTSRLKSADDDVSVGQKVVLERCHA